MVTSFVSGYIPPHARSPGTTDKSINSIPHFLDGTDTNASKQLNVTLRKQSITHTPTHTEDMDPSHPVLCAMFDTLNDKMTDQVERLKRMEVSAVNTNKALQFTQENVDELKNRIKVLENENKSLKK